MIAIKGRKVIDVVLEANINAMNEVVISTGYQKIEQKYLTGSVTRLKMDSMYQPGLTTVDKMLEGRVPGLIMMQNSGQAGAAPKLAHSRHFYHTGYAGTALGGGWHCTN